MLPTIKKADTATNNSNKGNTICSQIMQYFPFLKSDKASNGNKCIWECTLKFVFLDI